MPADVFDLGSFSRYKRSVKLINLPLITHYLPPIFADYVLYCVFVKQYALFTVQCLILVYVIESWATISAVLCLLVPAISACRITGLTPYTNGLPVLTLTLTVTLTLTLSLVR